MEHSIVPIDKSLRSKLQPIIDEAWAGPMLAINSRLWDTRTLAGFASLDEAGTINGYLLFAFHDAVCEIMVLESLQKNNGIGTQLIEAAKEIARENGFHKVIVVTTNDNLQAIRFYQKRGFTLRALRSNIIETSRKLKPDIPLMSEDGIPLRDELEFEIEL